MKIYKRGLRLAKEKKRKFASSIPLRTTETPLQTKLLGNDRKKEIKEGQPITIQVLSSQN